MHHLQRSWVRTQHPSAQWNLRGGRWCSVKYSRKKKIPSPPQKKLPSWIRIPIPDTDPLTWLNPDPNHWLRGLRMKNKPATSVSGWRASWKAWRHWKQSELLSSQSSGILLFPSFSVYCVLRPQMKCTVKRKTSSPFILIAIPYQRDMNECSHKDYNLNDNLTWIFIHYESLLLFTTMWGPLRCSHMECFGPIENYQLHVTAYTRMSTAWLFTDFSVYSKAKWHHVYLYRLNFYSKIYLIGWIKKWQKRPVIR